MLKLTGKTYWLSRYIFLLICILVLESHDQCMYITLKEKSMNDLNITKSDYLIKYCMHLLCHLYNPCEHFMISWSVVVLQVHLLSPELHFAFDHCEHLGKTWQYKQYNAVATLYVIIVKLILNYYMFGGLGNNELNWICSSLELIVVKKWFQMLEKWRIKL